MKKFTTLFFAILCCITMLKAEEIALTIHVETPGTLYDKIFDAGQRPAFVTKLTVTGTLNDDDFTCMRETMTSLVDIDLSGITNTTGVNFYNKNNLIKIILPENLIEIEGSGKIGAFSYCTSLTSITIPNGVTSIGVWAFCECSSLTAITIPNSVTSIGNDAFSFCSSLTSITIPNSVTSIGNSAFSNCSNIKTINIHADNLENYCKSNLNQTITNQISNNQSAIRHLFVDGIEITELNIPENVTSISSYSFYNFDAITSITIPNSVTSIGNSAFEYCSSLTSITIPNSVTSIGNEAFSGCDNLTSISIPNSVTSIGERAFSLCESLTSITIPNSVTSIGNGAFWGCSSLTSITIPNSVNSIGGYAFNGTPWLNNQPNGCIYINTLLYIYKGEMPENTHIDVKEGTTMICSVAFSECSSLTSITIPNSVTSIGESAFSDCSSLTSITIPNSVTYIGVGAFASCSSLTSITIPNSVTYIGDYAFYNCTSLTSITIPNSVTSIGNEAFSNCSSLTSITIPNSVTSIGQVAFYNCSSLTSITIPNSVTYIGVGAFASCSSLTSITIPNSVTSIRKRAFYACSSLTSITCLGSTPPKASALEADTKNCTLKVPNEAYNDYLQHAYWGQFSNIETLDTNLYKKLEILVNDTLFGYVNVSSGYYCVNNSITIHAIPNEGYEFTQWSDGNTENPRTICITSDTTITAEFRVATTPTTVENTLDNQIKIYTTNGTLHIEGATENYHILDAAGRLIYSGNATTLQLPRGIYLITMGGEVEKIVL